MTPDDGDAVPRGQDEFNDRKDWMPPPASDAGQPQAGAERRRFPLTAFTDIALNTTAAYLLRDIIPREGIVIVWGPPKCGKTFWTLDAVLHVALRRSYRGRRITGGGVVYVACEGARGIGARIAAWRQYNANLPAVVPFWLLSTRLDLPAECDVLIDDIRQQTGAERPAAVVIDTLNRSLGGSENKDEDMGAYIRAADTIREAFGCVVIIIHHCGHDATRPRGHTSLFGAGDALIAVRNIGGTIIATVEHLKDGEAGTTITSRLKVVDLGPDEDGEPITSCIIEPAEASESGPPGRKVPAAAGTALRLLRNAVIADGETPPASNHIPPNVRAVKTDLWRQHCYAGTITDAANPAAKRKAFQRAAKALQEAGIIAIWDDWVWLTSP